jgi:hypothetical protein
VHGLKNPEVRRREGTLAGVDGATYQSIRAGITISPAEENALRRQYRPAEMAGLIRYRKAVADAFDALAKSEKLQDLHAQAERRRRSIARTHERLRAQHAELELRKRERTARANDWDI